MAETRGDTKNVVSSENKLLHYTARALTVIVAGGSAVLSFNALTALAVAAGITPNLAWMWAIVVDGFILIATISVFALRKRGPRALAWPFFILGLFVVISIIGNGLHPAIEADQLNLTNSPNLTEGGRLPFWAAAIVTAVPPVALFLAIHLLVIMITPSKDQEKALEREAKQAEKAATKAQQKQPVISAPQRPTRDSEPITTITVPKTIIPVPPTPTNETSSDTKPQLPEQESPSSPAELTAAEENTEFGNPVIDITKLSDLEEHERPLAQRILAGERVTGQEAADAYGVSLRTGQGKLKKLREKLAA